jgi:hypothetical protein
MDRNEEFRKRLDKRLNRTVVSGRFGNKKGFDPTPYVDILMEKVYYEDVEDLQEFIDDVLEDPQFDFIFGASSLLNVDQKSNTAAMLLQRVDAYQDFDPQPHVDDLLGIYGTPAFDKYLDKGEDDDDDGYEDYNFEPYFDDYDLTKEQKELIVEVFEANRLSRYRQTEPTPDIGATHRSMNVFVFILFVLLPPFFIPNFLQRHGWLPSDMGWFLKIMLGILCFIVLFIIVMQIIQGLAKWALRGKKAN